MYFCTVMLSTQYSIGAYQTFNVTRVELIRIRHIPETRRALSMLQNAHVRGLWTPWLAGKVKCCCLSYLFLYKYKQQYLMSLFEEFVSI